ncbi:hypothetical protein ILUMI_02981 [Ignelater luminosus]|uniref:Uncharacterized protein n=1 Tax=Ignelater luminosus TaxID=2038154 RepID=A0A8K0DH78_IGNLU|nr:hypothetical protein ILUMI_02981 [Ignelater luminosus]
MCDGRRKSMISQFRQETGLLIDISKPGFRNTNDGNTARRFFQNPEISARITGIDQMPIYRFSVLLKAVSSGYDVDPQLYDLYAFDTAKIYVNLHEWYLMSPTLHILLRGKHVINNFHLSIGQLSEDVQELRHKELRFFREHNTRKISRKSTNSDLIRVLLTSSDPYISGIRLLPSKKKNNAKDALTKDLTAQEKMKSLVQMKTLPKREAFVAFQQ